MYKCIGLFICFSAYLCICKGDDDIFKSLEKLNLTPDQKNHISKLKSQVFYKLEQTEGVKPKVQQDVLDMFNLTSSCDIANYSKLLQSTEFLEICPQLVQTIDDLSRSFPSKLDTFKIITDELNKYPENVTEKLPPDNRTKILDQLSFSQPETWKILMDWIIYRMSISEKYTLSTLEQYPNLPELFMKLQAAFSGPARKEQIKTIVLDLCQYTSSEKSPLSMVDLKKRCPGFETTIKDITKYKKQNHFVHVFLPYGVKDEEDVLGLAIWLMYRIDSKDEEILKSEFPKIFEFRTKFKDELKQVNDIGQTIDITRQLANAYLNKK